jgi:hypothetical protein
MLCIDISVNQERYLGAIYIQRLDEVIPPDGICTYMIRKPKDGPWNDIKFKHNYDDGWFPLLQKAIEILDKHGYKTNR